VRELRVTDRLKQSCLLTGLALSLNLVPVSVQQNANAAVAKPAVQRISAHEPLSAGKTCLSDDPEFLCLGVKYVVYVEPNSQQPVISPDVAEKNFKTINSIWSQCKIGFQIDELVLKNPEAAGLPVDTADFSDLDRIRQAFNENSSFLIVTTYKWKRDSGLGHTPANAWTKMPGSGLYGVIMEQKVGAFPNIIAHELGHYLNLYHANDNAEVMNAIIYSNSNVLTHEQCSTARASVKKWWPNMVRRLPPVVPGAPQLANGQAEKSRKS
jgi:hypothetical protein